MNIGFEFHDSFGHVTILNVEGCKESSGYLTYPKPKPNTYYCVIVDKKYNLCWTSCIPSTNLTANVVKLGNLHCLTQVLELMYEKGGTEDTV